MQHPGSERGKDSVDRKQRHKRDETASDREKGDDEKKRSGRVELRQPARWHREHLPDEMLDAAAEGRRLDGGLLSGGGSREWKRAWEEGCEKQDRAAERSLGEMTMDRARS